jgi:hypothetical protein
VDSKKSSGNGQEEMIRRKGAKGGEKKVPTIKSGEEAWGDGGEVVPSFSLSRQPAGEAQHQHQHHGAKQTT